MNKRPPSRSFLLVPAARRRASFTMSCPTTFDIGNGLDGIFRGCMTESKREIRGVSDALTLDVQYTSITSCYR